MFMMMADDGGHGRRRRLVGPVLLVGVLLLLLLGERWRRRGGRADSPASGVAARPTSGDTGEEAPEESGVEPGGAPVDRRDQPVPATGDARAEDTPAEPPDSSAFTTERLVRVLDSWSSGDEPDVDDLEQLVDHLGREVHVTAWNPAPSGESGAIEGTVEIASLGLEGRFTRSGDTLRVDFHDRGDEKAAAFRNFIVSVRTDDTGITSGGIYVHQQYDVRAPGVLGSFGDDPKVVGWTLSTSTDRGTKLMPITVVRDGDALRIGPDRDPAAALHREWDWSLDRYRAWWSAFGDLGGDH